MGKDCVMCCNMDECPTRDGKFKCNDKRSPYEYVYADTDICNYFTPCWNWNRGPGRMATLRKDSKAGRGYYIMTAIMEILDIEDKEKYLDEFAYIKDCIMPLLDGGNEWVEDYDTFGPIIASRLKQEPQKEKVASSLYFDYIFPFHIFLNMSYKGNKNHIDEAIKVYNNMYQALKAKYNLVEQPKTLSNRIAAK